MWPTGHSFFPASDGHHGFRIRVISPPVDLACSSQRFDCVFAFSFGQRFFSQDLFLRTKEEKLVLRNNPVLVD